MCVRKLALVKGLPISSFVIHLLTFFPFTNLKMYHVVKFIGVFLYGLSTSIYSGIILFHKYPAFLCVCVFLDKIFVVVFSHFIKSTHLSYPYGYFDWHWIPVLLPYSLVLLHQINCFKKGRIETLSCMRLHV